MCGQINKYELGTMAERLRRKIRNLLGFSRAGSSPAGVVSFFQYFFFSCLASVSNIHTKLLMMNEFSFFSFDTI